MANYEQKNGQFTVWVNEKYTKGGNHPYAKGKGRDLQGNEIEVTLWIPKSDKIKGFNLTMSEPYKKPTEAAQPTDRYMTSATITDAVRYEKGRSRFKNF